MLYKNTQCKRKHREYNFKNFDAKTLRYGIKSLLEKQLPVAHQILLPKAHHRYATTSAPPYPWRTWWCATGSARTRGAHYEVRHSYGLGCPTAKFFGKQKKITTQIYRKHPKKKEKKAIESRRRRHLVGA
jgi:hypothetical protein